MNTDLINSLASIRRSHPLGIQVPLDPQFHKLSIARNGSPHRFCSNMDTLEQASRKAKQVGRQIGSCSPLKKIRSLIRTFLCFLRTESSMGNFKNMMSSISLVGDAKHFQEGRNKFDHLKQQLESKNEKDKLDGMKTLTAVRCFFA